MTTAATVKSVQGEAFVRSPNGGMRRLAAGDTIQQGEVVITSLGGQVSLATVDGQMINVNSQESFKFGPESTQGTAPQAGEAAVQPVVAQPGEVDVAQILEQDAAAAGLGGGGENGGNSFVRLMRITENLTPLNYEFQNPAGADLFQPEGLAIDGQPSAGDLVINLDEDDISEGEISTAWVGAFQANFAVGTNFDALYDLGNSDEAPGDDVPDPSPTTLSGHLNFSYGSDGVGDIRFNLPTAALTSGGLPVQFWLAADGHTLVGYVMEAGSIGEDQESYASIKVIFSAEITDVAAGAFSFTLWGPLDHPDNTTEDNLVIPFGFTVTDSDGDAAVGTLTLNLDDDSPVWQSGESGEDGGVGAQVNEGAMAYDDGDLSQGNDSGGGSAYGAPAAGTYMAELASSGSGNQSSIESFLGAASGSLSPLAVSGGYSSNATNGSAMKTTLNVSAGDQVSFSWAFDADDYLSYNDFAFVVINGQPTELSDISQVGSYGATQWATFTYTATSTGPLTLGFGVMNTGDGSVNSYLLVDKVQINGVNVPNGGFEAGNLSNWSTLGTANVVTYHDEIYGGGNDGDEASSGMYGSLANLVSFGADGPGEFSLLSDTSALPTLYSKGEMVGYSVAGNTLTATAGSGEDVRVVFTLTVNADGSWHFDLTDQLDHVPGDGENTALLTSIADYSSITSVPNIDFSSIIRVTDGDGDELTGPPAGSFTITVQDDVPTLDVGLNSDGEDNQIEIPSLTTQDAETDGIPTDTDTDSASFAGLFTLTSSVGADEPAAAQPALSYALSLDQQQGGSTGLTSQGFGISLSMDGNDVVGSTTVNVGEDAVTTPIFRISVDADGNVTLTQYAQIDHVGEGDDDNAFNNNVNTLGLPTGSIILTASASITDFDGDTASDSQSIDISGAISFDDDVPTVDVTGAALPTLTLDESPIGGGDGSGIVIKPQDLTNHNLANAIALDGHFTLGANPDVLNSETTPFVSIHATGNNAADYYAFTVTEAGSTAVFDIDYGMNQGGSFDPYIHLWNSAGVRIALNDDASTSLGEGGSIHGFDSYLTYTFAVPGTYYISVGKYPGSSNPDNPIPVGGTYQLQVSLTNAIMGGGDGVWTTSANFSGNFDGAYGADGPGNVAYALSLNGTDMGSGLYALDPESTEEGEFGQGAEIMLSMDDNDIVGTIGDTEYFRISVNADTGEVTFTRYESIWHAETGDHDDASWLNAATGTLLMTATVTDFDGDSTSASLDLSAGVFSIEDDGPTAALAEDIEVVTPLVVDESTVDDEETDEVEGDGIREAMADFTGYFAAPAYGADGPGSVSYALVLTGEGVGSGLYAVDADADDGQGDEILLYQEDDVIEGRIGDQVYFTISVDNDPESNTFGQVTFAQNVEDGVSVWHGDTGDHDDVESLVVDAGEGDVANSLRLVQTVTDADGDEAKAALDLGEGVFQIEDDGPMVTAPENAQGDYSFTATYQTVGYAGYNNSYGYYIKDADGNPTTGEVIWANVKTATGPVTVAGYAPEQVGFFIIPNGANKNTGLIDGDDITFQQVSGVWQAFKGTTALVGTGANIFFDKAALNVDGYSHVDDNSFLGNQNWEDLLGSTDSDYEDVNVNITWNGGLRVDESDLNTNAEMDLSGQFTVKPGADGLQSLTYALNVVDDTDSGLVDSLTGEAVLLRMNGTAVEGYAGSDVVFTLSVDEDDGKVTLDQLRAVEHPTADPNEYVTLANANLITLTATATDNDGDTAFDTVNIGTLLHFADDRPLAVNDADGVKEDNNIVATGNVLTGVDVTGGDTNTTDGVADIAGADGGLSVTSLRTGAIGQWSTPTAMGSSGVSLAGTYGTLTLLANGDYSYALNNAAANVQSLKEGETKTDAFTYAMKDADGDSGTATLTITIIGTNDLPVVTVGGGMVYESGLDTGTAPSAITKVATDYIGISDVDNTFTGATGEVVVKTQGSNGNASVAWNATAGKWEWTYTLATAVDNDASGTNVEPGVDAFVITVNDGSGGVVDKTINISIVDDTPVFNSVMDAILSSATQVNFDGNYSASFGADGVDYLSAVLGTSGYVGTTAVTYQKSAYSSTVTQVDVMNGATKLFSFYYESTTNAVNAVGGNHDGSVVINAFGDPDNVAGTQFFTLAVKADGTYSFDMISNTILSSTTVSGSDFGATSPQTQLVAPSGTLVITGTGGGNLVNGSNNGIGVKTIDISDGDNLKLDFQSQQAFVSFKLVQWTGNDADQASVTLKLSDEGSNPNIFNLAVNKNDLSVSIIVTDDNGLLTGGLGGTSVYYAAGVWTVYVNNAFDDVDITNASKAPGFAINNITYDQVVTVEDLTMNFNLAVTDRDGDTSSLTDTLTVSMVNPDSTINATTITTGVDGNDGVVMVGNGDADTLVGGNGNDILIGDGGSDVLTGGAGSDTFKWELGDASVAGTVDHITDFNLVPKASGGDVLDLTDLLSGETNTALSLDAYLNFSAGTGADAGKAVITVDVDGSGAGTTGQAIVLDNITYSQLQSYAGGAGSDVDIINKLLTDGNLKVTGSP